MTKKERIKKNGEVFTPLELVDEILNKLPEDIWADKTKTFIDPACGDGNFLVRIIAFKIEKGNSTVEEALSTTYGVELMEDNVQKCKERLLQIASDYKGDMEKCRAIVNKNIVCKNSLEYDFSFND